MKTMTIGCVGMTHLGLVHAVAFAAKGFHLIAYDDDAERINDLQQSRLPISEPQLPEFMANYADHLHFTNDLQRLAECELVFIACDVPTDAEGNSDLTIINDLIKKTLSVLSIKACLIILSQVPPGFTRRINLPRERLFYQVETLIFGQAMVRALHPERYIIGVQDPHHELPSTYLALLNSFTCPVLPMCYESAELAKIAINMFLVSSVSTTNTLAEVCENVGADWREIVPALRLDKRIGQFAYLTPGLGIAGGNLERDLNTIIKLGKLYSTDTGVVRAWLKNSQYRRDWVLRCLQNEVINCTEKPVVCILGLAYKANTHSIKNSPALALIEQLLSYNLLIRTHDPVVTDLYASDAKTDYDKGQVLQFDNVVEALQKADAVIIMTPWDSYQRLTIDCLLSHMRGKTIIDPYRTLKSDPSYLAELACNYFTLGQKTHQSVKQLTSKELSYV